MKTKHILQLQVCLLLFGAMAVDARGRRGNNNYNHGYGSSQNYNSSGSSSSSGGSNTNTSTTTNDDGSTTTTTTTTTTIEIPATGAPSGEISADKLLARAGTFPKLSWDINYPQPTILEIIDIEEDGTIVPKSGLTMRVKTLAADVQERRTYWSYYHGRYIEEYNYITVAGYGKINNRSWNRLFYGTQPSVDSTSVVWEEDLESGDEVIFAARAYYSGLIWHYSGRDSANVLVLKDGDTPPHYATWDTQSTLGTHIAPYLDANGRVDIGPRDVIVAFELTHIMPGSDGDMQDMIFLLTFDSN